MAGLVDEFDNVVVKRIDIVSWESDAFRQINEAYGVKGIPYLRVYGTAGELLGEAYGYGDLRKLITAQANAK